MKCTVCGSTEGPLKTYSLHIDGERLSLNPVLCTEHGENFVFRVGMVMGSLLEPIERVFLSAQCGFILASCICTFRKHHAGEHSFEEALRKAHQ